MDILRDNILFEAFASASESVYIYVCDMETDKSRWSASAVEYFDMGSEYLDNAAELWLTRIHPNDREAYLEDIIDVFNGTKDRHACQYRARNRYGEYVWLECHGSVVQGADGKKVFAGMMTRLDGLNKYDALTDLLTIYEFYRLDFSEGAGAIVLLGIDDFRKVINSYGYSYGNEILVDFSKKLSGLCGTKMTPYRFHGDEFLVVAPESNLNDIQYFYERVQSAAESVGPLNGQKIELSISAGAVFYPSAGRQKEELVNSLEHSLEYAKRKHRGDIVFYSQKIAEKHKRFQLLKEDIRNSIHNDFRGFELYFQPLVIPGTHKIVGCESLLRWQGEYIKDSGPSEFIEILEYDGNIRKVGLWVMEEALRQQREWHDKYGDIFVSFNVSYQQFVSDDFVDRLILRARQCQVNPNYIIVELTESCEVEEPAALAAMFNRLRAEGFRMALDDFGTAYASLELLKKLPADFIKIEHSFVRELAEPGHEIDMMIIENLLSLCKRLNCKSIVEGVENEAVDKIVGNMDVTWLQGYCFSKPVAKETFEKMLEQNGE